MTLSTQKERTDLYTNTGLLQKNLDEQRESGTVMVFLLGSEIEAMPGVNWRPVAFTILYNESGTVKMHKSTSY